VSKVFYPSEKSISIILIRFFFLLLISLLISYQYFFIERKIPKS